MRVVGFSGGADSQATALWARKRFPADEIILLNTDAGGNEHPITVEFIEWYSEHVFPVTVVPALIKDLENRGTMPGVSRDRRQQFSDDDLLTFDRLAYINQRFPSRRAQFCTYHLKIVPQKRWCQENLIDHGIEFERYIGVRRDESPRRANTPDSQWDEYFDCILHAPIAGWTKTEVFDYLRANGERWNPLYEMFFGRVGCAPCINSGKEDIRNWASRFPEMIDKVREWEQRVGRTFFAPCVPGLPLNWVDEVVEWSRTDYGGKQTLLPIWESDLESCSSRYGLCE